jgi:prepilin-type processing-associated H-X9-DG protein
VREKAKSTYCQNNLQQFGKALRLYLLRYSGFMPCSGGWECQHATHDPDYLPYYPVDLLCQQIGRPHDAPAFIGYPAGLIDPQTVPKVCYCPSAHIEAISGYDNGDPRRNYQFNAHIDSWGPGERPSWAKLRARTRNVGIIPKVSWSLSDDRWWVRWCYVRESSTSLASTLAVMGDTADRAGRYTEAGDPWMCWGMIVEDDLEGSTVADRHLGGGNLVFLDGHVEWKPRDFMAEQGNLRYWMLAASRFDTCFYPERNPFR